MVLPYSETRGGACPFSRELVACDPTGLTTLAIPLQPDQGVLLLGTLVVVDGTRALLPAHAAGVLSMTVDTDGMPPDRAYAIYTRRRFSWRAVTLACPGLVFDQLSIAGLRLAESISKRWALVPHTG